MSQHLTININPRQLIGKNVTKLNILFFYIPAAKVWMCNLSSVVHKMGWIKEGTGHSEGYKIQIDIM